MTLIRGRVREILPRRCGPQSYALINNLLGLVGLGQYAFDGDDPGFDYQLKEFSDDTWKQLHVNQEELKIIANDSFYTEELMAA